VNIADAFSSTLGTDKTDIYGRFVHPEAQRALHLNETMIENLRKTITENLLNKSS
jgi:hypothetical protein